MKKAEDEQASNQRLIEELRGEVQDLRIENERLKEFGKDHSLEAQLTAANREVERLKSEMGIFGRTNLVEWTPEEKSRINDPVLQALRLQCAANANADVYPIKTNDLPGARENSESWNNRICAESVPRYMSRDYSAYHWKPNAGDAMECYCTTSIDSRVLAEYDDAPTVRAAKLRINGDVGVTVDGIRFNAGQTLYFTNANWVSAVGDEVRGNSCVVEVGGKLTLVAMDSAEAIGLYEAPDAGGGTACTSGSELLLRIHELASMTGSPVNSGHAPEPTR